MFSMMAKGIKYVRMRPAILETMEEKGGKDWDPLGVPKVTMGTHTWALKGKQGERQR
jgi:hypothetical protein